MLKGKLISLNIILDYPVKWSKYKVLRDFIQNFYDALTWGNFNKGFSYQLYPENTLTLTSENTGFSYEWLLHMGASTKRESPEKYAGYFGEGFKVAALCALRDFGWRVRLSSQDWLLEVTTSKLVVDDNILESLAYRLELLPICSSNTVMAISNIDDNGFEIFKAALYSFYYPQNPLIGATLWENEDASICYRTINKKPGHYPTSYGNFLGDGIVFGSYQALGSLSIPIVFSLHNYSIKDRDREFVSEIDVVNIVTGVVQLVPPEVALIVLPYFKKYWHTYPKEKYGHSSYYTVVKNLVKRIYISSDQTEAFMRENPNLLVVNYIKNSDMFTKNRRTQALSWLKVQCNRYILVQDSFAYLGYPTLEDECERYGGFSVVDTPGMEDRMYIDLIEETVAELLVSDFYPEKLPQCKIISNDDASWMGMANCKKLNQTKTNVTGLKLKYSLSFVAIKKHLLKRDCFEEAFTTYLHELCHCFGGESSVNFNRALTEVISILLKNPEKVTRARDRWREL